jgi:hypothetical protein
MRSMVEGAIVPALPVRACAIPMAPSTTPLAEGQFSLSGRPAGQPKGVAVPLPVPGRIR